MNKKLKVRSPTGVIHYANSHCEDRYTTLYRYKHNGHVPRWIETKQPVTCKRCLKQKLLNKIKDNKCNVHICHSYVDPKKDIISVSNFIKSNLLKILISQGYVTRPLKKGEQIAILIYKQGINFCK